MDSVDQQKPRILHVDDFDEILDEFRRLFSEHFDITSRDRLVIEVEIERIDARARVVYRDNGIGVDPDHLDRIFNASFTTDRRHHYGLGLSFVLKIVEAHGGHIAASSDGRGKGAQFVITLPVPRSGMPA